MKKVFIFIAIVLSLSFYAQEESNTYNQEFNLCASISVFNNTFNFNDYYYGFSMGVEDLGYQWGARFNFQFRPFYKRVQIQETDFLIRQYREKKYFISIDLDKRFLHINLGGADAQVFMGTQIGYLLGNYRGTRNNAERIFNIVPMGGLCVNVKETTFIKVGFCYLKDQLIEVPDVKFILNVVFALPEGNDNEESIPNNETDDYYNE